MGKRSKQNVQKSEPKKKTKILEEYGASEPILSSTDLNTETKKQKSKKINSIKNVTEKKVVVLETDTLTKNAELNTRASNKTKKVSTNKKPVENKKVVFIDDEPVEVSNDTNAQKKIKNPEMSQEDDIKDEDIDKFCEKIDEEDNVQYLNWVEQIEAKLNSNKKKPK